MRESEMARLTLPSSMNLMAASLRQSEMKVVDKSYSQVFTSQTLEMIASDFVHPMAI